MKLLLIVGTLVMAVAATVSGQEDLPNFDTLWNYDKPAETEKRFRKLLPRAEGAGDVSYRLQLLTQIARTLGLQGKFVKAHRVLDDVEGQLTPDPSVARLRYFLERGRVFNSSGNAVRARPLFLQAWDLGRASHQDFYAVDAAHMMAIIEPTEMQLEWNLKALALAEGSDEERARNWRASLHNNIGMTYLDQNKFQEALDSFQKGLVLREKQGNKGAIRIAKWTVAKAMRKLGRLDEALAIQQGLERELAEEGEDQDGFVFEEIAEILLARGKPEEARPYFRNAHDSLKKIDWVAKDKARLERLRRLGGG